MYQDRDDWDGDSHRFNPNVHYRLYLSSVTGLAGAICVQDFDYPGYDARLILHPDAWATEAEAEGVLVGLLPAIDTAREASKTLTPQLAFRVMARTARIAGSEIATGELR